MIRFLCNEENVCGHWHQYVGYCEHSDILNVSASISFAPISVYNNTVGAKFVCLSRRVKPQLKFVEYLNLCTTEKM